MWTYECYWCKSQIIHHGANGIKYQAITHKMILSSRVANTFCFTFTELTVGDTKWKKITHYKMHLRILNHTDSLKLSVLPSFLLWLQKVSDILHPCYIFLILRPVLICGLDRLVYTHYQQSQPRTEIGFSCGNAKQLPCRYPFPCTMTLRVTLGRIELQAQSKLCQSGLIWASGGLADPDIGLLTDQYRSGINFLTYCMH